MNAHALERSVTAEVREPSCPGCGFPVHSGQPILRVHIGAVYDGEGMTDLMAAFHKACGAAHLIQLGHAKTEAQRTRPAPEQLTERTAA